LDYTLSRRNPGFPLDPFLDFIPDLVLDPFPDFIPDLVLDLFLDFIPDLVFEKHKLNPPTTV
jgi:hypothetical protein